MSLGRREFFKLTAAGSATILASKARASNESVASNYDQVYGVLVDTVVCIGCRKCEWACNNEHKLSNRTLPEFEDKSVFEKHRRPEDNAFTVVNRFVDPKQPGKQFTAEGAMHALQQTGLRFGVHCRCAAEEQNRIGRLRCLEMHRLPLLHGGLSVSDSGL